MDAIDRATTEQENTLLNVVERTQASRDSDLPLSETVCFAAADYKHAQENAEFAAAYGGVEQFKSELFKLVNEWVEARCDQ